MEDLKTIAEHFQLESDVQSIIPLGAGFINDTYIVSAGTKRYVLQRKNPAIFKYVPAMLENTSRVSKHLQYKYIALGADPKQHTLILCPNKDGTLYYQDSEGAYWSASDYIENSRSYERADTAQIAYKGGAGIGQFQAMLADFHGELHDTLPGFHDIRFRFEQWDNTLRKDPLQRKKDLLEEIDWIESRRVEILAFKELIENGTIPKRIAHNDTKISNMLFDEAGEFMAMIDLDTLLSSTVLYDYGDSIRSYTNTGAEDDPEPSRVSMSMMFFEAFTAGYLSEAKHFLSPIETEHLYTAARYITFEQVLRFLMDYIDGDKYYKIAYAEHNLVRARAQHKLLCSIESKEQEMKAVIEKLLQRQ